MSARAGSDYRVVVEARKPLQPPEQVRALGETVGDGAARAVGGPQEEEKIIGEGAFVRRDDGNLDEAGSLYFFRDPIALAALHP